MKRKKAKKESTPATTTLRVDMEVSLLLEVRNDLVPDDEWRSVFYGNIKTLNDVAAHFAYNRAANGIETIDRLDGFADRDKDAIKILKEDFDIEHVAEVSKPTT